jgi:hypothetical protein
LNENRFYAMHMAVAGYQTAVAGYQTAVAGYQTALHKMWLKLAKITKN